MEKGKGNRRIMWGKVIAPAQRARFTAKIEAIIASRRSLGVAYEDSLYKHLPLETGPVASVRPPLALVR